MFPQDYHKLTGKQHLYISFSVPPDVIHTVGPVAQGGVGEEERRALRSCYRNSLQIATENASRSVVRTSGCDESERMQLGRERGMMTDEVKIQ